MKIILSENKKKELIEELAALEHEQWEEWSRDIAEKEDISEDRLERWKKYWINYDKLDEETKDQDREWAEKVLNILDNRMKEIKSENYKKAQIGIGEAIQGVGQGMAQGGKEKNREYAQLVINLINQGMNQQQAFDTIMNEKQIGKQQQALRNGIINEIKNLYHPVQPASTAQNFKKTWPGDNGKLPSNNDPSQWAIPAR